MRPLLAIALLGCAHTCLCSAQIPPARTLYETSFEEGTTLPQGWQVKFGTEKDFKWARGSARTGKRCLHITDRSEKASAGIRGPQLAVRPGDRVWVQGWFLTNEPGAASIYIEYWDAKGKRMNDKVKSFGASSNGKWQQTHGRHIVPDGASHVTVLLYSYSKGKCDGYFDDVAFGTGFRPTYDRTPRPPAKVKHPCGPYSLPDIERAKKNVEKRPWARKLLQRFTKSAQFWIDVPDAEIRDWIPELTPFRVVDCPNCDAQWAYCWKHLPNARIKCRKCGTIYPNDKFPEAGTETLLSPTGKLIPHPYYKDAKGKKHRLSGRSRYARINHLSKLGNMGRYYALTGDLACARKAVKVMRRLAEVYPDWVPHDWTRLYEDYSNTQSGKMSGWKLHDCNTMLEICLCYDLIYDSGALSEDDKVLIENGLFREFGEFLLPIPQRGACINDGPFQMSAAAYVGVLLGDHRLIQWAVEPPGGFLGFVRDYFFRDGHWEDGSPSYESMALSKLYLLPEILQGYSDPTGYTAKDRYDKLDVLSDPLVEKIHIAPLYNMFPNRTLPPINDGAKGCGYSARHAEVNYFWYPTQRNLEILNWVYKGKIDQSGYPYSLFRRDPERDFSAAGQACLSRESVLRPGLGWAILREGEGQSRTDLVLDYGAPCGWHGHPDRLNFVLYANEREVLTDLGYLGARHPFRPWMAHGICHNLVMVDGNDQAREPGKLIVFQPGSKVQAVVAEAPKTYPQCSRYERAVVLITPAPGVQYVADVFRVAGGRQHDFSFHGDGAVFECPNLRNAKPHSGDLGPEAGGYTSLENPKTVPTAGEVVADWRFGDQDPSAAGVGVRLRILDSAGTLINAKGPNLRSARSPYEKPMLDYVIQRRRGPTNTFVSVVEPVKGNPVVTAATRLTLKDDAGRDAHELFETIAVKVSHRAGIDYVIIAPDAERRVRIEVDDSVRIELAGRLGVVSLDLAGEIRFLWLADGTLLRCNDLKLETAGSFSGKIVDFDRDKFAFAVDVELPEGTALAGQPIIAQDRCDGAYTVDHVETIEAGSRVYLRHEPIVNVRRGEEFRLPTYAVLTR